MDYSFWGSLMTVIVVAVFSGIVIWAFSAKREAAFDAAARLPLEDDPADQAGAGAARR